MTGDEQDGAEERAQSTALERLRAQVLERWHAFPRERADELDALLGDALAHAGKAEPELLTVMNPTSRPQRLRLAVLVGEAELDSFYGREWAELCVSAQGRCYLVYRRRDGGDYAVEWSPSTTIPGTMMSALPDVLELAMLEGDDDGAG